MTFPYLQLPPVNISFYILQTTKFCKLCRNRTCFCNRPTVCGAVVSQNHNDSFKCFPDNREDFDYYCQNLFIQNIDDSWLLHSQADSQNKYHVSTQHFFPCDVDDSGQVKNVTVKDIGGGVGDMGRPGTRKLPCPEATLEDVSNDFRNVSNRISRNSSTDFSASTAPTRQARSYNILGYFVPNEILSGMFTELLSLDDICRLDTAMCNKKRRPLFLEIVGSCVWQGDKNRELSSFAISWLYNRSIKIRHLKFKRSETDIAMKVSRFGSSLHQLSISDPNIVDESIIEIVANCLNLQSIELLDCSITDKSIIRLAECCPDLHSIFVSFCANITDTSIIRLAEKCTKLQILDLSGCINITDASIVKLAERCPMLHSLDLSLCPHVTDAGIIRLSEGCPKIKRLRLYRCRGTTMRRITLEELFPHISLPNIP
jgi:hypothetical protein